MKVENESNFVRGTRGLPLSDRDIEAIKDRTHVVQLFGRRRSVGHQAFMQQEAVYNGMNMDFFNPPKEK